MLEPKAPLAILDPGEPGHRVYPLRIVVDALEPVAGPVELRPGVRAVDVPRAIAAPLADVAVASRRCGRSGDNGDDRRCREATEYGDRIEELIEQLEKIGARVGVVGVQ